LAITDYDRIPQILEEFTARLVELGPNPYKGF
jgi:quinone-modifying oxidoreductase, subunit QmoB